MMAASSNEPRLTSRRILIAIKSLGRGGAERLLVNAAPYLDRSRFDYTVAYLGYHSELMPELVDAGIPVIPLHGDEGIAWPLRLRSLVLRTRADLVHVHSPVAGVVSRLLLPHALPLVYTEHNVWPSYHRMTYWTNLLTYRMNDHVFSVSEEVRQSVQVPRWARSLAQRPVEVLHHGLDPAFTSHADPIATRQGLGLGPETPLIGCVAGFKPQKGHVYLLRAFQKVREQIPEATLLLVGSGPLLEEMKALADDLEIADSILFVGNRADVADLVDAVDLFVLPSLHEGLPIALLEALALGTPVVATRVGGVPEVISSDDIGLLIDPTDVEGLAEGVRSLLQDPDRRRRMGERGRKRAADFDIRSAVARMEEVYDLLLQAASPDGGRAA